MCCVVGPAGPDVVVACPHRPVEVRPRRRAVAGYRPSRWCRVRCAPQCSSGAGSHPINRSPTFPVRLPSAGYRRDMGVRDTTFEIRVRHRRRVRGAAPASTRARSVTTASPRTPGAAGAGHIRASRSARYRCHPGGDIAWPTTAHADRVVRRCTHRTGRRCVHHLDSSAHLPLAGSTEGRSLCVPGRRDVRHPDTVSVASRWRWSRCTRPPVGRRPGTHHRRSPGCAGVRARRTSACPGCVVVDEERRRPRGG